MHAVEGGHVHAADAHRRRLPGMVAEGADLLDVLPARGAAPRSSSLAGSRLQEAVGAELAQQVDARPEAQRRERVPGPEVVVAQRLAPDQDAAGRAARLRRRPPPRRCHRERPRRRGAGGSPRSSRRAYSATKPANAESVSAPSSSAGVAASSAAAASASAVRAPEDRPFEERHPIAQAVGVDDAGVSDDDGRRAVVLGGPQRGGQRIRVECARRRR